MFLIRRSYEHVNYSLGRLRGWLVMIVVAFFGAAAGAAGAAANLALVGTLGFAELDSAAGDTSLMETFASIGVTLACAAVVAGMVVMVCDWISPMLVRSSERDRLHSRWGLRWLGVSFAMMPFVFVFAVLALFALGFNVNG